MSSSTTSAALANLQLDTVMMTVTPCARPDKQQPNSRRSLIPAFFARNKKQEYYVWRRNIRPLQWTLCVKAVTPVVEPAAQHGFSSNFWRSPQEGVVAKSTLLERQKLPWLQKLSWAAPFPYFHTFTLWTLDKINDEQVVVKPRRCSVVRLHKLAIAKT